MKIRLSVAIFATQVVLGCQGAFVPADGTTDLGSESTSEGSDTVFETDDDAGADTGSDSGDFDTNTDIPSGCEGVIEFPDANLEAAVRTAVGIVEGNIYYRDVNKVDDLYAIYAGISDITGIQCLSGLTFLDLSENNISDISALSGMTDMVYFNVSNNDISDVGPLSGLTAIEELYLSNCNISDITPLSYLPGIYILDINENSISDISTLSSLDFVMQRLNLSINRISDISPLVENERITGGDEIDIRYNPIDCDDPTTLDNIAILEGRRVSLSHDCSK